MTEHERIFEIVTYINMVQEALHQKRFHYKIKPFKKILENTGNTKVRLLIFEADEYVCTWIEPAKIILTSLRDMQMHFPSRRERWGRPVIALFEVQGFFKDKLIDVWHIPTGRCIEVAAVLPAADFSMSEKQFRKEINRHIQTPKS